MKKYIITSLLFFVPFMSMAADRCTSPQEFTVDKRCYVTDKQKKVKPYNTVVGLLAGDDIYCTGTVREFKGNPYIYTAKHCVADMNGIVDNTLEVQTWDGEVLTVNYNSSGNRDTTQLLYDRSGDWSIYSVSSKDKSKITASTEFSSNSPNPQNTYNARVIGYGALKIMSDKEINQFKQKYIKYLSNKKGIKSNGTESEYGWREGGVYTYNGYGHNFWKYLFYNEYSYYKDIFKNTSMLKVSRCTFSGDGVEKGCQIWSGNSGGGVFDDKGNLMGILCGYNSIVGGKQHASSSAGDVINVNFLR